MTYHQVDHQADRQVDRQISVLHVTPHLGGGIGKALNALVHQSIISNSEFIHDVICLEKPIKREYVDKINKIKFARMDNKVIESHTTEEFKKLIEDSDIVQLEWINNPTIIKYLISIGDIPIRLITWFHNNGLYSDNIKEPGKLPPTVPEQLILASDRFILTTRCSFNTKIVKNILRDYPEYYDKIWSINSCGGFDGFPDPESNDTFTSFSSDDMSIGYFGTTNFAKLHPQYVNFLKEVDIPGFKVKMIGECSEDIRNQLNKQCEAIGKKDILQFTGYLDQEDLIKELSKINVLVYILNPRHYGTAENSLLECMTMGIVPVVLNNEPEKCIVKDRQTGLIIGNPKQFAKVIKSLQDPDYRQRLGISASRYVRKHFTIKQTNDDLNFHYKTMTNMEKRKINFTDIFRQRQ